jgi:hypothetical protein
LSDIIIETERVIDFLTPDSDVLVETTNTVSLIEVASPIIHETATYTLTLIAGENINGHRAVIVGSDGLAYLADSTDITHAGKVVGISTGAVTTGFEVNIQIAGKLTNPGWGLTPNSNYFFNSNGVLTATMPTGFVQIVGVAQDSDTLIVNINLPIINN